MQKGVVDAGDEMSIEVWFSEDAKFSRHRVGNCYSLKALAVDVTPAAVRGGLYLALDTKLLATAPVSLIVSNCTMSLRPSVALTLPSSPPNAA